MNNAQSERGRTSARDQLDFEDAEYQRDASPTFTEESDDEDAPDSKKKKLARLRAKENDSRTSAQQSKESRKDTANEWKFLAEINAALLSFRNDFTSTLEQKKTIEGVFRDRSGSNQRLIDSWATCERQVRSKETLLSDHRISLNKLTHEYRAFWINLPYAWYRHVVSPSWSKLFKIWRLPSTGHDGEDQVSLARLEDYRIDVAKIANDIRQLDKFIGTANRYGVLQSCRRLKEDKRLQLADPVRARQVSDNA